MRDRELYARILGVERPWQVTRVELEAESVEVFIESTAKRMACPECGEECDRYDTRPRRWRHLDTCQYRTMLIAEVPRVRCPEHGVRQVLVPWAEPGSGFTALFESLVIDWLHGTANISAVARLMRLSWDQIDGIYQRAVKRGLARRDQAPMPSSKALGVDEKSFQRRHEYVTTVVDCTTEPRVLHVADGRGREALAEFLEQQSDEWLAAVQTITMDMWGPYISAARAHLPNAGKSIAFDRFHVAKLLSDAVDRVRRQENRELRAQGDERLKGTRYLWLRHPDRLTEGQLARFEDLRDSSLKTARAWALRELAIRLWERAPREDLEAAWGMWYAWAIRSRLAPIKKAARTIRYYLWGVINAIHAGVSNSRLEGLNASIQRLKTAARGFRSRPRFRDAIYFHFGGLDLYPRPATHHTTS